MNVVKYPLHLVQGASRSDSDRKPYAGESLMSYQKRMNEIFIREQDQRRKTAQVCKEPPVLDKDGLYQNEDGKYVHLGNSSLRTLQVFYKNCLKEKKIKERIDALNGVNN